MKIPAYTQFKVYPRLAIAPVERSDDRLTDSEDGID